MSSFIRSNSVSKKKSGFYLDNFLPSLDNSLILIKEDEYSYIHEYLLNTFLSEGVHNKESNILAVGKNKIEIYDQVSNLNNKDSKINDQVSKMYIAWRYSSNSSSNSSSKYSLSNKLEYKNEVLKEVSLDSLINKLKSTEGYRISIYSLFSPSCTKIDIERSLYELKKVVRKNKHICLVSVPTYLYEDINFNQYFDSVMSLDSNIFDNYLPNYKAVIHFEKINLYKRIRENENDTFKFGIKFSKDRLVIEKIDIPPEDIEVEKKSCSSF
ncbi:hypothetical protein P3W45_001389 [Vairimorpha bombi]|jgi:hypothetical protein